MQVKKTFVFHVTLLKRKGVFSRILLINFLCLIGQRWVTCPPLNQSLQEKWNHRDWLVPINVSKASEGKKETWTEDWESSSLGNSPGLDCSAPGLVKQSVSWTLLLAHHSETLPGEGKLDLLLPGSGSRKP